MGVRLNLEGASQDSNRRGESISGADSQRQGRRNEHAEWRLLVELGWPSCGTDP